MGIGHGDTEDTEGGRFLSVVRCPWFVAETAKPRTIAAHAQFPR